MRRPPRFQEKTFFFEQKQTIFTKHPETTQNSIRSFTAKISTTGSELALTATVVKVGEEEEEERSGVVDDVRSSTSLLKPRSLGLLWSRWCCLVLLLLVLVLLLLPDFAHLGATLLVNSKVQPTRIAQQSTFRTPPPYWS